MAFHPGGKLVAAGGLDKKVLTWNTESGAPAPTLSGVQGDIYRIQFNADGSKLMAVTYAAELFIWNPGSEKPIHLVKLPIRTLYGAAYAPGGQRVVVAAEDANAYLIELPEAAR